MNVDIPKQYLEIQGKTLLEHTLTRLLEFPLLEKMVLVLAEEDDWYEDVGMLHDKRILLARGGEERCHSVLNGLDVLLEEASENDWVLVHDVARPCIRKADLEWLVSQLSGHEVGGLLGIPVRDTMKRTDASGEIIETVSRDNLWHALTPQMFRIGVLRDALKKALDEGAVVTDEASALEFFGVRPLMVEGHTDNIKVTRGTDLALASLYIQQQNKLIETID